MQGVTTSIAQPLRCTIAFCLFYVASNVLWKLGAAALPDGHPAKPFARHGLERGRVTHRAATFTPSGEYVNPLRTSAWTAAVIGWVAIGASQLCCLWDGIVPGI